MQTLVYLLFVAVINVGVCQECAPDWLHFQGYCYGYGETAVSWTGAQAVCLSEDAKLAEISTLAVNNFLSTIARHKGEFPEKCTNRLLREIIAAVNELLSPGFCVWFGGSDIFHEGDWKWSSRQNDFNSFTNWHSGEPNNGNNDEDCLNMYQPHNYNWNDGDCNINCNFICAAPASNRE